MPDTKPVTHYDFFINAVAHETGLIHQFWHQAYIQFLRDVESNTSTPGFDMYDIALTVRIPFRHKHIDVLVRCQPEPREYRIMRLTAFPAGDDRRLRYRASAVPCWERRRWP